MFHTVLFHGTRDAAAERECEGERKQNSLFFPWGENCFIISPLSTPPRAGRGQEQPRKSRARRVLNFLSPESVRSPRWLMSEEWEGRAETRKFVLFFCELVFSVCFVTIDTQQHWKGDQGKGNTNIWNLIEGNYEMGFFAFQKKRHHRQDLESCTVIPSPISCVAKLHKTFSSEKSSIGKESKFNVINKGPLSLFHLTFPSRLYCHFFAHRSSLSLLPPSQNRSTESVIQPFIFFLKSRFKSGSQIRINPFRFSQRRWLAFSMP